MNAVVCRTTTLVVNVVCANRTCATNTTNERRFNLSAIKSKQLGMPISTARSRLVKQLLFRELVLRGVNICARCDEVIDSIDELSIEHIKPWLHVSAELFWDLDNVAFSHSVCNSKTARPLTRSLSCPRCNVTRTPENTSSNISRWDGRDTYCKPCRAAVRYGKSW